MIGRTSRSEGGAVMVITAVALFAMLSLLTFAIDVSHWFDYSRNLQNRADAAALAAGDAYGNICFSGNAGNTQTGAQSIIGKWAQLYSGAGVSEPAGNVPYSDAQVTAATGFDVTANGYINNTTNVNSPVQSPLTLKAGSLSDYFLRLNADNYATKGGTDFVMGDFCNADPSKDLTDLDPGPPGAMVDVKLTQRQLPNFIPIFNAHPNISAHARVTIEGVGQINAIRPIQVRDPSAVPCVKVNFIQTNGSDGTTPATQTVTLQPDAQLTGQSGPVVWDNAQSNGGLGDQVKMPTGADLSMQAVLYAQGADGTCNTVSNPFIYGSNSGLLYLSSYGNNVPAAGNPPALYGAGPAGGGGVTLVDNTCSPDQYFSSGPSCSVMACAIVAFTQGSTNQQVQLSVNGAKSAVNMTKGNVPGLCSTSAPGTSAWTKTVSITGAPNGYNTFDVQWQEDVTTQLPSGCKGKQAPFTCTGDFGVQQTAFAACNELTNLACNTYPDANDSGGVSLAQITDSGTNQSTVGSFQAGTSRYLIIHLNLQGLQNAAASDRCPSQCTVLRFGSGQADGSVNCGQQGGSTSSARTVFLAGCPLFGDPLCSSNNQEFCGPWMQTPDGSCNNLSGRTTAFAVDCVGSDNNGATIPECVGALIQTGGTLGGPGSNGDPCSVDNPVSCSEDHWITDGVIEPNDPRIIDAFITYPGDVTGTGNTVFPIRNFSAFYVTGWQVSGNGKQINCPPSGPNANEPTPPGLKNSTPAIWGHWFSYVVLDAGGNGKSCNFTQGFGLCTPTLTR